MILGSKKRPELMSGNVERNRALEVKKGDRLRITKYSDTTVNGEHIFDEVYEVTVLGVRKGKDGRRVKVDRYNSVMLIDVYRHRIDKI